MTDFVNLIVKVDSRDVEKTTVQLKKLGIQSGKTEKATKKTTEGFGSMASAIRVLSPLMSTIGFAALAKQMIDVARETERYKAQLLTMTGSAIAAGRAFKDLNEFAKETPFTLKQSIDGFVKLKALGLDPSERAMKSYGNTASAMGKSMQQMIEAVADASTNEFERLKEFGIKARQKGEDVTFTFQGVETTIRKSSDNIQKYLMAIGETNFAGAMENQVKTIDGQLSNLSISISDVWRVLGEGLSVTSSVTASLKGLSGMVDDTYHSFNDLFRALRVNELIDLQEQWNSLTQEVKAHKEFIDKNVWSANANIKAVDLTITSLAKKEAVLADVNKRMEVLNQFLGLNKETQKEVNQELGAADAHYKAYLSHVDKATVAINKKNKALAETCERVRVALSCEDKLLFEYDEIAKATYDREQAIKDLDYALQNTFMTTETYIKSLKKIEDEYKGITEETKEIEKQTKESTKVMTSAWEELNINIQSEFINTFVDMLTGAEADFEDFTRSIAKMWLNTTMNMAFSPQMSGGLSGGSSGGNLASTQTNGGYSSNPLSSLLGAGMTSQQAMLAQQGSAFTATGSYGAGVSNQSVGGVSALLGGYVASEIGDWEGVVAGGVAGAGAVAAAGAMGIGAAGAAAGGGMAGASMALTAMGPIGWAALAIAVLAGSGVFSGNSDVTPDLNVGGFFGGSGKGAYTNSLGSEENGTYDPVFGYQGTFGTMGVGTQHDGFDSEEAAQNFVNGVTAQFANMDNSIAEALGSEMTNLVVDALGTMQLPTLKGEESEDWTQTLEDHYRIVFGTAMSNAAEITGNEDWGIWDTLSGDMASIVYVTTEYVSAQGELKSLYEEMLDIHSKDANIIAEQMGNWSAVNNVMEMLGVNLYEVNLAGVDAANALVNAAGGLVELANLTGYFYETFYSSQEKGAHYTKLYADTVGDLNDQYDTHISTSTTAYKHWTLEILNNADASAELKVAMLELAPVTAQVIQAEQAATAEREAYIEAVERAIEAGRQYTATIDDLLLGFTNNPDLERAKRDKQAALSAFDIDKDAMSFTESDLKVWLEYLKTLDLTGDAAELAETKAKNLYSSFYVLEDVMIDMSDASFELYTSLVEAANAMAEAQATLKAQSMEVLERFNDELAISNLSSTWGKNFAAANEWLDGLVDDFGLLQSEVDAYKITGGTIYELNDQMGRLEGAISDTLPALKEMYGNEYGENLETAMAQWIEDSSRWMDLTETDEHGASTLITQSIRASTDNIVDSNHDLERVLDDLTQNFGQFMLAVKELRKSIDTNIASIRRTQPGWSESDYQSTMISALTKTLTGGEGDLDIYSEIQAAVMERYNAELELISEAKAGTEELYSSFENIGQYLDSLQLSSVSPLTASERLAESKAQYTSTLSSAQSGDIDALNNIASATDTYLVEARTYYASSLEYSNIWDSVNAALESLVSGNQTSFTEYEQAKELLDNQTIAELNSIDASVAGLQYSLTNDFVLQTDALIAQMTGDTLQLTAAIDEVLGTITEAVNPIGGYQNPPTAQEEQQNISSAASQFVRPDIVVADILQNTRNNPELIAEMKSLTTEVANLRLDQVRQTTAIIVSNNEANERNANDIVDAVDSRTPVVIA